MKPTKKRTAKSSQRLDTSFVDYIIHDQLGPLDVEARRMFGGFGLYCQGKFFGLISDGDLYLKTDDKSRVQYIAAGMGPFVPNPRQTLKAYYQVPVEILEDAQDLQRWVREAVALK